MNPVTLLFIVHTIFIFILLLNMFRSMQHEDVIEEEIYLLSCAIKEMKEKK